MRWFDNKGLKTLQKCLWSPFSWERKKSTTRDHLATFRPLMKQTERSVLFLNLYHITTMSHLTYPTRQRYHFKWRHLVFWAYDPCNTNPVCWTAAQLDRRGVMLTHKRNGQLAAEQCMETLNLSFQLFLLLLIKNLSMWRLGETQRRKCCQIFANFTGIKNQRRSLYSFRVK